MFPDRLRPAAVLLALTLPVTAQLAEAPATPTAPEVPLALADGAASPAWQSLGSALLSLDLAMVQQLEGSLWSEVRDTVRIGRSHVSAALRGGAPRALCLAADTTLAAAADRQDYIESVAFGSSTEISSAPLEAIERDLALIEGRLSQTTVLRVETLFELGRDTEAQQAISHGLMLWPKEKRLHEQAVAWGDLLPAPEALIAQLMTRFESLGMADPDGGGLALETAGLLHDQRGRALYGQAGKPAEAAKAFEKAVSTLGLSNGLPRSLTDERVDELRAQASVNASYAWQQRAKNLWYENGRDDPAADEAAARAEKNLFRALELDVQDPAARQAAIYLGDMFQTRGGDTTPNLTELGEMREFYGRIARAFDVAEWWNNFAFWSRETGTATEEAGDEVAAAKLYEQSYDAYTNAVRLDPENARYVNDTGLMLLYHLGRDLDEAERLFLRSWELGKAVCENPFVEQAVYDHNLSAYGDALLNLSRLYLMQGELERADEMLGELLAVAPDRVDALMTKRQIDRARDEGEV